MTVEESRFDFQVEKDGLIYYIEVKGVPNASTMDPPIKKGKQKGAERSITSTSQRYDCYFPDGYRKAPNDPIKSEGSKAQPPDFASAKRTRLCALVFVVQRPDCNIPTNQR